MIKKIGISFIGVIMCFVFLQGNIVFAQSADVDVSASASYNVDVRPVGFFDKVKLFFTFNQEKKANLLQDFSQRNFAIATQKIEQGNTVEAGLFFQKSDEHTARATATVSRIPDLEKRNEILSRISNTSEVRLAVLTEAQSRVENETAKESLSRAIANQEQIYTTAGVRAQANAEVQQMRVAVDSRDANPVTVDTRNTVRLIVPVIDSTRSSECNENTQPWIKVLSPNGGEEYTLGQEITVTWESCNIPADVYIGIDLKNRTALNTDTIHTVLSQNPDTGSAVITLSPQSGIPSFVLGNNFRIEIFYVVQSGGSTGDIWPIPEWLQNGDISDNFFKIGQSSSEILTQSKAETLVQQTWGNIFPEEGCTQECGSVSVSVSQNSNGQYVVTVISTELDDSVSQTKRVSIASFNNGVWTLGSPTITRMCHRGNYDGTTGWTSGLCI